MNLLIAWWAASCPLALDRTIEEQTTTLHTSCALCCWLFKFAPAWDAPYFSLTTQVHKGIRRHSILARSPVSILDSSPNTLLGFSPSSLDSLQRLTHQPEAGVNAPVCRMQVAQRNKREAARVACGSEVCCWALQSQTESFPFTCPQFDLWINKDFLFPEIPLF